ncbi:NAD(P)/FAD-dependent oxidoreductase [Notoacmeibacter ruber]|uniref:FAD-binding oxidoreductase n=1 Tax=Notoacmeibacter ruber TaxID=2670375 RepID=A0A3L7J6X8_9HYPH|nr:FAD-dependent oxidoreductase [Notoacmeibacter ruber]RLQ85201.1 FAD-binding oxidoreductase [Notoacmeibacter ruber]
MSTDVLVIGGGIVGAALAYGAIKSGRSVVVLDGADSDFRAARANFGLVWTQGKGADVPAYNRLTLQSSELWPDFLADVTAQSRVPVDYARPGGLTICLGDDEFEERKALLQRMHNQGAVTETVMLSRSELEKMMPDVKLGPEVTGASYCKFDGHVNPLQLLAALHRAISNLGGKILYRHRAEGIEPASENFTVRTENETFTAKRVIVAAGLGTSALVAPLGFSVPIHSSRGQILVTERMQPLLPYPASGLRQTADGTVMIGATKEATEDRGVTVASARQLANRALKIVPALSRVRLVRHWSGLRILSPDGAPIYAESKRFPGLFAAVCHSGVTLAAAHADIVAPAMLSGRLSSDLPDFSNERFDVQEFA